MSETENAPRAGFYETFRTSGGHPHHWRFNAQRLRRACTQAGLALPPAFLANDEDRLHASVRQLLETHRWPDAVFRYTVESGSTVPAEKLAMRPLPAPSPEDGVALRVLALPRTAAERLPRPKRANDTDVLLGAEELARRSSVASDEGLFLSGDGSFVVETTRQAIFWISGDTIRYPDSAVGGVAGTCFSWVHERGLRAEPVCASLDEMLSADAVAVCNAVRGVTPVCEVWDRDDRARLRTFASAAHPILKKLSAAWSDALRATAEGSR